MKTAITVYLIFFLFLSCNNKNSFIIHGSFKSPPTEDWIYLTKFDFEKGYLKDSAKIEKGKFQFKGEIQLPEVYSLRYNEKEVYEELPIFLEPGKFEVTLDPKNPDYNSEINGGILNRKYKEIVRNKKNYMDAVNELSLEAPDQFEDNYVRMIKLGEEFEKSKLDFIKNNPNSPISIYLLDNRFSMFPLKEQKELLSSFNPSVHHMNLYKEYKADYDNQVKLLDYTPAFYLSDKGLEKMEVDFSQTTILKTLIAKNPNKPMYIDVWGTWCGPCIASFPDIKSLQEKFDDKDLLFVYLCVRSREEVWSKMIRKENLIGQHYLLGNDLLDRLYREARVSGFPSYILINREGKVCLNAPRPHSENIEQVLLSL